MSTAVSTETACKRSAIGKMRFMTEGDRSKDCESRGINQRHILFKITLRAVSLRVMDHPFDSIKYGNTRIELSIHDDGKFSVVFTLWDNHERRILRAPIMENGVIKLYEAAAEAIQDAMKKLSPTRDISGALN